MAAVPYCQIQVLCFCRDAHARLLLLSCVVKFAKSALVNLSHSIIFKNSVPARSLSKS
jgi:hypothetical protein